MRIGLISDTHGYLDPRLFDFLEECDEIWHAGDIGSVEVADQLEAFRPLRAVWGNIDDQKLRYRYPEQQRFSCCGVEVLMIHIGGYPGRYAKGITALIRRECPDLFIAGHSHVVRAMPDERLGVIHLNPGACGREGFHNERTVMRFDVDAGALSNFQICRLGPR